MVPLNITELVPLQEVKVTFFPTESPITIWETVGTSEVNMGVAAGEAVGMVARIGEAVKVSEGSNVGVGAAIPT